ncbi:MAG: 16S rRNA processing protein RimM [Bacteroidetes bacterium]|nr:16S rRNA processing protein RimM [Bacteroidota bacterium]
MGAETLVRIGRILRSHGLKGELKVSLLSEHCRGIEPGTALVLESRFGQRREVHLASWREGSSSELLEFEEINNRESADPWAGGFLLFEKQFLAPLPPGEYYVDDLIGLEVFDESGKTIGTLTDVYSMPASDLYEITVNGCTHLIPARGEVVKSIDLERRRINIDVIPGLLE